jgi:hypothetical protein
VAVKNCLIAFVCFLFASSLTQETNNQVDLYQKIPHEQREALKRALHELLDAQKKGDWQAVYRQGEQRSGENEASFVETNRKLRLLHAFVPTSLTFVPPFDKWVFEGCATFDGDSVNEGSISTVGARWENSRWNLSPVAIALYEKEHSSKCTIPNKDSL